MTEQYSCLGKLLKISQRQNYLPERRKAAAICLWERALTLHPRNNSSTPTISDISRHVFAVSTGLVQGVSCLAGIEAVSAAVPQHSVLVSNSASFGAGVMWEASVKSLFESIARLH